MSSQQLTLLDMLLETSKFLKSASANPGMDKEELCKSMENRISVLIARMVSAPMGGSFSIFNKESPVNSEANSHSLENQA